MAPKLNPLGSVSFLSWIQEWKEVQVQVLNRGRKPLFLGLNATEKVDQLTVQKDNFVSMVGNPSEGLKAKYAYVFGKGVGKLPAKVDLKVHPVSG